MGRARERLQGAGIEPDYHETTAGHSLPAEIIGQMREFVTAATATEYEAAR